MLNSPMKTKLFSIAVVGILCACSTVARAAEPIKQIHYRDAENLVIHKVRMDYPIEARRSKITGSGVVVVKVNTAGIVTSTMMGQSTGSPILDRAAVSGLKLWRFKPGPSILHSDASNIYDAGRVPLKPHWLFRSARR